MSQQFPVFGQPAPEPAQQTAPAPFEEEAGSGGKGLRHLLAGAAAVTVLGGGALGFLWLSTPPSAEVLGGTAGVRVTPPVAVPTSSPGIEGAGFAVSARDVFVPIATPTTADAGGSAATSTSTSSTSTSTGGSGSTSTGSSGGSSGAVGGSAVSVGGSAGSSGATSTVTVTAPPSTTTAPVVPAPVPPTAQPTPTPSPSRSTAPPWEVSNYTYLGTDLVKRPDGSNFLKASGSAVADAYFVRLVDGDVLYPADITFRGEAGGGAHLTSNRGVVQGWVVPTDTPVPAAAMGRTTGTVRVVAVKNPELVYVQVNRGPSILVRKGEQVKDTPLTFDGLTHDGLPDGQVYFLGENGVLFYGSFGAGEDQGVTY